jgi:hypothetical protein
VAPPLYVMVCLRGVTTCMESLCDDGGQSVCPINRVAIIVLVHVDEKFPLKGEQFQ